MSDALQVRDNAAKRVAPVEGLVAVLDALGTKLLSLEEAMTFVALRDSMVSSTASVIETGLPGLDMGSLKTFTFNDTLIYAYAPAAGVTLAEVERFCHVLRVMQTRSIIEGYPFRGAFAVGPFFIGDERTVLGPAVSDAASWFEAADWLGIHATPHATVAIQALLEKTGANLEHVLLDYDVPMGAGQPAVRLKAVNWPKGFYIKGLRPPGDGTSRGLALAALAQRRMPRRTESKYFNAIAFFDHVTREQKLPRPAATQAAQRSAGPTSA